ncbi:Hypothetical protein (Fragment) [Durusdinium trenchii]|uniref:Solute-binding protein family 3/N-terminal domain-containing protein n=1 Tax=Durusdinium trenchii TaxID=1381693 RepID=A0ABP0H7Q1_9DINO
MHRSPLVALLAGLALWLQGCSDDEGDTSPGPTTGMTTESPEEECKGPLEPMLPGIMPGSERPKIILGQDIDWPPYAYLGVPPESDFDVAGIGHDIAHGLKEVCDIDVVTPEIRWGDCWDNGAIDHGLAAGKVHGCMTYTHTWGARTRFLDFSKPILQHNKPAGLLVKLENGVPKFDGNHNLNGLKVVDVVGWAPTADTLALVENKCTKARFSGFTIVQPTATGPNANQNALETLMNGDADAMWVYADQAKNYQCTNDGTMTPNWDCTMWAGFGTTFAYIQTGLYGHAQAGTTLAMSKRGSGLGEILNPCLDKFLATKSYYDICKKHGVPEQCFPNSHFPSNETAVKITPHYATDELTTTCADGYCPCPA